MWKKMKYLFNVVLFFFIVTACFADTIKPQFLSGFYVTKASNPNSLPLILASKDRGQTWSMAQNIPLLSNQLSEGLYAIDCTDSTCIAGGVSVPADGVNPQIFLMRSDDFGKNWNFINSIAGMPHATSSALWGIKCFNAVCLAYGEYTPPGSTRSESLILRSSDKGLSWTTIEGIKDAPAHPNSDALIEDLKCEENACVATYVMVDDKAYFNDKPIYSMDNGQSWTYVKDIIDLSDYQELMFSAIKCQGDVCNAAGSYLPANETVKKAIMLRSQDKGQHWQAIYNITGLPDTKEVYIEKVSYSNHLWLAAGEITSANYENRSPFILISKDKGKHWEYLKNFPNKPEKHIGLNALYCDKQYCVVAGFYADEDVVKNDIPLYVTTDHGNSFKAIDHIENFPPIIGARIHQIQCKHTSCTAFGSYGMHPPEEYFGFVLNSQDKGRHWSYAPLKDFPKDLQAFHIEAMSQ